VEVKCDILVRMGIDRGCLRMVQGIMFRPEEEEVLEFGENYVMRICMSCVLHVVLLECRFQKDEMGRACSTCGRYQKCICGWKPWSVETC
jgi:hypothetical protein